ncbi:unnamed protein product, partial [Prorocentrum cordatum]
MTSVVDGLWNLRNAPSLEKYCGVAQQGGLATYLAVTDLQWACDVASHLAMLFNAYEAGVRGDDWLLLDDFMSPDAQYIVLRGQVASAAAAEQAPYPRAKRALRCGATRVATEADKAYLLDRLGSGLPTPLQFVDDLTVATSSPGALRAIVSREPWSACSRYASYKFYVVRPALLKLDQLAFQQAAAASLPVFRLPFSAWLSGPPGLQWNLLDL